MDNRFQVKGKFKKVSSSVLHPETGGLNFIVNIANMEGKTTEPIYSLFDKKWVRVKQELKGWYSNRTGAYKFGAIHDVSVQSDIWVVSCLCKKGDVVDLPALELCLKNIYKLAKSEQASVHVPGLVVAEVPEIIDLCKKTLVEQGISVYAHDMEK